ncbi:restriction endonuclease subunit S [Fusobacterium animalis]|uniref:Type I restriction modification DNA specificity domain protein n=1 Tax=Fusobacterium nucleatum TaxID=851 RepID=A0A133NE51_FUSNU|nr:restriction endonuclease subunit S [Fusobacterium nucleatum]KXA14559.1 type I restriction modification DNA specificity domain protein [Fusobacterium nucleatum]MCL4582057.1 restriction endonuclease subunit S [Fusobacterium nucleatum YWH7054]
MAKNKKFEISLEEKLEKALVPVEEQPYKIPDNWVWTRLGEVNEVVTGNTPSKNEGSFWENKDIFFVKPDDLSQGRYLIYSKECIDKRALKKIRILPKNTTLICCIGSIGKVAYSEVESCSNQQINSLVVKKNCVYPLYNYYLVNSTFFQNQMWKNSSATTISILNKSSTEKLFFPLSPLNEQKRIVEKLDFLFDKTKRAKEIIEEIKIDIENRKISILDRAFKGVLTSEWRNKNKVSDIKEVLKSINNEKIKKWEEEYLQAEKEGKKKPKKPIIKKVEDMIVPIDEQPYKLPDSWVWVRLGDISERISKGTTPRGEDGYIEKGVNFLRVENIDNNNSINLSKVKYISEETHNSFLKRSILKEKDILISIAGTLGRTAIVKKEDLPANINQAISFVRLIDNNKVLENFIVFYLNSPTIKAILLSQVKVTAIPNLTLEIISDIKFPLPPLEEQQEIVRILDEVLENENKVKELLELEERIDILEKSILNKAFKGELGTKNSSDEPAIELLKEIL